MQIVIPMAGRGKRFEDAGFSVPKPLIEVHGRPMIQLVVENLGIQGNYIFICRKDHYQKYSLETMLNRICPRCQIILVDQITEGAASTVLLAKELINNEDELVIANSDQWVDWHPSNFLSYLRQRDADGGILTFTAYDDKWSFVKLDENGRVTEVAEKKRISDIATVGIYYYKKGSYFVKAAEQMIEKNIRINNEFYVAPAYNEMILAGKKIYIYPVSKMLGLGTPTDLEAFLRIKRS